MKKAIFKKTPAFTMLELVFIIIIVGILAAVLIPRMGQSRLREAADQVVSHIRYTQHLAMMDDKFGIDDTWYKARWQIEFVSQASVKSDPGTPYESYVVFSDTSGGGMYELKEMAANPLNPTKRIYGGSSSSGLELYGGANVTNEANLGKKYGIKDVVFDGGCNVVLGSRRLSFDYLGRPMIGNSDSLADPYRIASGGGRLLTSECTITLKNNANENINITVQPETGYASVGQIY